MNTDTQHDGLSVSEEAAGEMLGLPLLEVRRMRRAFLLEGTGFKKEKGGRISISATGLRRLAEAIAEGGPRDQVAAIVERIEEPVYRDLVVDATCPNPRIVLAHYDAGHGPVRVRVRVRDGGKFARGMRMSAREVQPTLFAYEGRPPRARGVW